MSCQTGGSSTLHKTCSTHPFFLIVNKYDVYLIYIIQ